MVQLMSNGRGKTAVQSVVAEVIAPGIGVRTVLDDVEANIFVADLQLNIVYANPKAVQTLQALAPEIQRVFGVRTADILGGSIHRFHQDPARIDRILQDPRAMPRRAQFTFGTVTLDTHINRVTDPVSGHTGFVVAWEDVSEKVRAEEQARAVTGRLTETFGKTKGVSAAVQSVSTAMEEMSTTVTEIARSGSETTGVVASAVTVVEAATITMNRLGEASMQINEVVNTISQIARQTNLLALNATIEAARAGEAGKGFAVVAGEVKDLSSATQTATKRIGDLIENVQGLSRAASEDMAKIAGIIDTVRDGQNAVAAAVEEQTVTNHEIARNLLEAAEQAESVTEDVAAFLDSIAT